MFHVYDMLAGAGKDESGKAISGTDESDRGGKVCFLEN